MSSFDYLSSVKKKKKSPFDYMHKDTQLGGLSKADRELYPYLQKQANESQGISPLEFLLDVISVGQYSASNFTEDFFDMVRGEKGLEDLVQGQVDAFTLKRKGDWTTTIFGGKDPGEKEEYEGLLPQLGMDDLSGFDEKVPGLGDMFETTWKDAVGFVANIFGDPSTYISWGSSGAAKAAAKEFAEQAVKQTLKGMTKIDDLAKIAGKGINVMKLSSMFDEAPEQALKMLQKSAGANSVARLMNKVKKEAYEKALAKPPALLQEEMLDALRVSQQRYMDDAMKVLTGKGKPFANKVVKSIKKGAPELAEKATRLESIIKNSARSSDLQRFYKEAIKGRKLELGGSTLIDDVVKRADEFTKEFERIGGDEWLKSMSGAGERALNLFGIEVNKGVRQPWAPRRAINKLKESFKNSRLGQSFSRALDTFSATKLGRAVSSIKQAFGIKNPYQEMLNNIKMENFWSYEDLKKVQISKVKQIFDGVDEATKQITRDLMDGVKKTDIGSLSDLLHHPELWKKYGLEEKHVDKVKSLFEEVAQYTAEMNVAEERLAKQGLLKEYNPIIDYLPHVQQEGMKRRATKEIGTPAMGFTKHQKRQLEMTARQDASVFEQLLGVNHDDAMKMAKELNWGTVNMDLEEMLMYRGMAHAQAVSNANLVEQFKSFGVKIDRTVIDMTRPSKAKDFIDWVEHGNDLSQIGLHQIETSFEALKNVYFDEDVAKILNRVIPVTSSDEGLHGFERIASKLSAWWKGFATMTPGFHVRNAKSNIYTLYMKDGIHGLNPKRHLEAMYAVAYALHGDGVLKNLDLLGKKGAVLDKVVNGRKISDWADLAKKHGIITKAQMGFDLQSTVKSMTEKAGVLKKANPFDTENFIGFKGSKELGAIVESTPKFHSFMNDIRKMAGDGDPTEAMIKHASRETKKWFFDYEDLSEFEKKYMKNIIPFYTWLRKNVALQVTNMMENRARMSIIPKFQGMIRDKSVSAEDLPEYMRKENYIPFGKTDDGKVKVFNPNMPYEDLNLLPFNFTENEQGIPVPQFDPGELYNDFLSSANPVIKTLVATAGQGYDPFRRQDLSGDSPAPRAFRFLAANPDILTFLDATAQKLGMEDGLGLKVDDGGKLKMNAQVAKVIEDNFLLIKRLDDMGDAVATVFPEIEKVVEDFTKTKHPYSDLSKAYKAISFALGHTQREYDQDQADSRKFQEMLKRAEEMKKKDRSNIPGYKARSEKYYRDRQKRLLRLRSAVNR